MGDYKMVTEVNVNKCTINDFHRQNSSQFILDRL